MADITIKFPIKGQSEILPAEAQNIITSPAMMNCVPFDVSEKRARGGQREGTIRLFGTQIGGEHPIIDMLVVNTTYLVTEE